MITHTQVVTVCVQNQEKALQFYTELPALKRERRRNKTWGGGNRSV